LRTRAAYVSTGYLQNNQIRPTYSTRQKGNHAFQTCRIVKLDAKFFKIELHLPDGSAQGCPWLQAATCNWLKKNRDEQGFQSMRNKKKS
jgi:hypothetical protein